MTRLLKPALAIAVLTAVIIGGFFIGVVRTVTDTGPDW